MSEFYFVFVWCTVCGLCGAEKWVIIVNAEGWDPRNLFLVDAFTWAKAMNSIDACESAFKRLY